MVICFVIAISLLWSTQTAAQASVALTDARYTRTGLYQRDPNDALIAAYNQALLPNYKSFSATAFVEKRFLLDDLSLVQFGIVMPVNSGAFALQTTSFGSMAHRQSKVGLAYGRPLTERLNIGVQFHYLHYQISGYGQAGAINAAAGILYQFSPTLSAGLHIDNITGSAISPWKGQAPPQVFSVGLGYTLAPSFYIDATLVKQREQPLDVQTSVQYVVQNKLLVKGGLTTASSLFYFGGGYRLGTLQLEATASWHPHLGISPGLMLTYKKERD